MSLELRLTKINPNMTSAVIECCYVSEGAKLKAGDKLFDVSVDLSSGFSQYCPPISYFRIVSREGAWLQKMLVKPGDKLDVGAALAILGLEAADPIENAAARALRVTTAGIAHHANMWSATDK